MEFQLWFPRRIVFGTGTFSRLGELCAGLGDRAVLVTGRGAVRRSGRLQQAMDQLAEQGIEVESFEGVENDPSLATCQRGTDLGREFGCNLVVGIGGGSALDAAKTIAAVTPQAGRLAEYFRGERAFERSSLPFVAVPTTAGTGSECTPNAVLTDTERGVKKSLRHESMVPDVALVDPELTLTVPPEVTAQTGMDALTQAIECYVSLAANPATDAPALRAIQPIAENLPKAVADGSRIEYREPVALGSLLTAMAFGNGGLGAVHGLAHPIGLDFHVPHGLVCAVLLPHVCEFNLPAQREKFESIARLVGACSGPGVPDALMELNRRVGIPETFEEFGMTESGIPKVVANCRSGSMAKNPRPASDEDLIQILRKVVRRES